MKNADMPAFPDHDHEITDYHGAVLKCSEHYPGFTKRELGSFLIMAGFGKPIHDENLASAHKERAKLAKAASQMADALLEELGK